MKKLTDWEVGQELIAISDFIADRSIEFKNSHPDIYFLINEMRLTIGDKFNKMNTHDFAIASHETEQTAGSDE